MKRTKLKKALEFTKKLLPQKVEILFDKIPLGCYNAAIGGVLYMGNNMPAKNGNSITKEEAAVKALDVIEHISDGRVKIESEKTNNMKEILLSDKLTEEDKSKYFADRAAERESNSKNLEMVLAVVTRLTLCGIGAFYKYKVHELGSRQVLIAAKPVLQKAA